jgi:hypothetical protein
MSTFQRGLNQVPPEKARPADDEDVHNSPVDGDFNFTTLAQKSISDEIQLPLHLLFAIMEMSFEGLF